MNKLEEYKNKIADEQAEDGADGHGLSWEGIIKGFDAALALDLPIKYQTWLRENKWFVDKDDKWYSTKDRGDYSQPAERFTEEQLYKYWLKNIFKIE